MENLDPVPVVSKLIELCWKDLNDPSNVFQQGDYFYSATMYIKKGICLQPEAIALRMLQLLEAVSIVDRYYAKERMQQPHDAIGMPQRILDLDRKKWIRSSRLEEEDEDHQRRLRREVEEMNQRDQLTTQRHLLTMEQKEDLARQAVSHTADTHWQGMQFRSMDHDQAMRYKDHQVDQRFNEIAAMHRLKHSLDQQNRGAQLDYDTQTRQQKLDFMGQEQGLRFDDAQAQQQLKLGGISKEHELKNEQETKNLHFKELRGVLDNAELNNKLRYTKEVNADKVTTHDRLEDINRDSQQRKNVLDQNARMLQLEYQASVDNRKLMTEGAMNQHRRDNNDDQIRARNTLLEMSETDRQKQLQFNTATDNQKLRTLQNQRYIQNQSLAEKGRIENSNLRARGYIENNNLREKARIDLDTSEARNALLEDKGRIESNTLREKSGIELETSSARNRLLQDKGHIENQTLGNKNRLLQDNRNKELQHTSHMGHLRVENERGLGEQKARNEIQMGQVKVFNERNIGHQRTQNEVERGYARALNERNIGQVRNAQNREALRDKVSGAQAQAYIKQAGQRRQLQ